MLAEREQSMTAELRGDGFVEFSVPIEHSRRVMRAGIYIFTTTPEQEKEFNRRVLVGQWTTQTTIKQIGPDLKDIKVCFYEVPAERID